jgi:hypothetical protein
LPKTPQRQSAAAGASELALDSLDKKIPIGNWESAVNARRILSVKWRTTSEVSRRRTAKDGLGLGSVCPKIAQNGVVRIHPFSDSTLSSRVRAVPRKLPN